LFHGPDEAQSRGLGERLLQSLGASKFALTSAAVKSDPGSLTDAAGAMILFGGARAVWIDPATKDIEEALQALLDGPAPESVVVGVAGSLNRTSSLLKLAETAPAALACISYLPEGRDAERMVVDLGRRFGLKIAGPLAAQIAQDCGNDQAIAAQELQKLALYIDASPQAPKELDHAAVEAVGAETAEGDFLRLADLALGGDLRALSDELSRMSAGGSEAIPAIRSLQRRLLMLAPARARVERGESPDAVMTSLGKSVFWKEKAVFSRMISTWSAEGLATAADRIGRLERELMLTPVPAREALSEELIAVGRRARTKRG
jgi:DNA polymerase-3 subunit delta